MLNLIWYVISLNIQCITIKSDQNEIIPKNTGHTTTFLNKHKRQTQATSNAIIIINCCW